MGSLPTSQFGVVSTWLVLARFHGLLWVACGGYEPDTKSRGTLIVSGIVHIHCGSPTALIDKPGMDIPQWDPSQHHRLVWCQHGWFWYCWPDFLTKPVTRSESLFFSSRRRADQSFGQIQLTRSHSTVDMVIPESIRWSFCNFISHNHKFYDIINRR